METVATIPLLQTTVRVLITTLSNLIYILLLINFNSIRWIVNDNFKK